VLAALAVSEINAEADVADDPWLKLVLFLLFLFLFLIINLFLFG